MPVSNGTLGELVRAKRPEILAAWHDEVRKLAPAGTPVRPAAGEAITTLLDHVAEVAERIAAGESQLSQEVARQHARGRAHEGLEFADVLRDFAALRAAIMRCSQTQPPQQPLEGLLALDRAIDEAVIACVAQHLDQRDRSLRWVDRMVCAILETKTLEDACRQALAVFIQAVPLADLAAIFLRDGDFLRPRACSGPDMELARLPVLNLEEALVFDAAAQREPQQPAAQPLIPANAAALLRPAAVDGDSIDALVCLPLQCAGELIGLVYVGSLRTPVFADDDLRLLTALARRAAAALSQPIETERAHQAVRGRDDVLAMVSHDLGNPLGAILISASSLLGSGLTDDADHGMTKGLQAIHRAAGRMRRMIQDLVDFVRIDSAQPALRIAAHAPEALAKEALEGFESDARKRGVALRYEVPSDLPNVLCDRERTLQVLSSLLGNALSATTSGGTIGLRAGSRPHEVLFSVSDTGPGIAQEDLQHVFDRFYRSASNKPHRSVGLALAVARSIVDAHDGGKIWAESQPGAGSKILFTLPAAEAK
jgi:signal transduction histidine kinase